MIAHRSHGARRTKRYAVFIPLPNGKRFQEDLFSDTAEACLKDYYHVLLDQQGDDFRFFSDYDQWLAQLAAAHHIVLRKVADLDRLVRALVKGKVFLVKTSKGA